MKTFLNLLFILGLAYIVYSFTGIDNKDEQVSRDYDVSYFNEIEFKGPFEVMLTQGDRSELEIRASERVHSKIEVYVKHDRLIIDLDDKMFSKHKGIKVYLTYQDLNKLIVSGAVNLETTNVLQTDDLKIEFEGAGQVRIDIEADRIISEIEGVGSFWFNGTANYHKVEFSGVGSYDAKDLISKNTIVDSEGVGTVEVYASEKFIGHASGVGSVKYYGNPLEVSVDSSGIGKVHSE